MTDGAFQGQVKQVRISLEREAEKTRQHASTEAEKTRQALGGKLDSVDAKLSKLNSIDGKLNRLVEIAEQIIKDESWKGKQS